MQTGELIKMDIFVIAVRIRAFIVKALWFMAGVVRIKSISWIFFSHFFSNLCSWGATAETFVVKMWKRIFFLTEQICPISETVMIWIADIWQSRMSSLVILRWKYDTMLQMEVKYSRTRIYHTRFCRIIGYIEKNCRFRITKQ